MRKIFLMILCMIVIFLVSCTHPDNPNDPNDPWEITSEELFHEYYPLYIQKVFEVIDESNKAYTFEDLSNTNVNFYNRFYYKFDFEDSTRLYIMFTYHGSNMRGRINASMHMPFDRDNDNFEVDTTYFTMLEEINQFSTYHRFGDENTFSDLIVIAKQKYNNGGNPYAEYYVDDYSLGNRYEVRLSSEEAEFSFSTSQSSRNIIN